MPIRPEMKARYPKDWKLRSKFIRFYRAKNRCEWCGAENHKPHPITGSKVILTTAHIYDHRPEVANLLNLAALCQRCHIHHDAKRRKEDALKRFFVSRCSEMCYPWQCESFAMEYERINFLYGL